jgi:alpha-glucosidase
VVGGRARGRVRPERTFYFFGPGQEYAAWLGVPSLPKLDHSSPELRRRLFEDPRGVIQRWLGPDGGLDGWRVDVANMTGRHRGADLYHQVARDLRAASCRRRDVSSSPSTVMTCRSTSPRRLARAMNYAGFTRPVWTWLTSPTNPDAPADSLSTGAALPVSWPTR